MLDFLVKIDIWINVHVLRGYQGETISSRLGRAIERDDCMVCRFFCRTILLPLAVIFRQEGKHCRKAIQDEYRK